MRLENNFPKGNGLVLAYRGRVAAAKTFFNLFFEWCLYLTRYLYFPNLLLSMKNVISAKKSLNLKDKYG